MSAELRIRSAEPGDLSWLFQLARESFSLDTFSRDLLAEKLFPDELPPGCSTAVLAAEMQNRPVGFMQSVVRPGIGKAWVGLFAVEPAWRRRRVASALLDRLRTTWPEAVREVEVLAIPGNYFTPGLDPRYTEAVCFLERSGFSRFRDCVNLTADLTVPRATDEEARRLAGRGIIVRRAEAGDEPLLDAFFAEHFGADWRFEVGLAMAHDPPTLHLALQAGRVVGFSAHSTQNREWGFFGPMGTAPEARGIGVGRVLLWRCLDDLQAAGHATALIPWVGPIAFYMQWARARVARVFWRYRWSPTGN